MTVREQLLAAFFCAAERVFMDGSTPWEVDEALENCGFAKGPFERSDDMGLDVVAALCSAYRRVRPGWPAPLLGRMLALGKLGRKTGAGWYRYPGGGGKVDDPIVADLALEEAHFECWPRGDFDAEEITERVMLALICEAAMLLDEGRVTPSELNRLSGEALGGPVGGIVSFAEGMGLPRVLSRLESLVAEDPQSWRVVPLLRDCAERGRPLGRPA